MDQIILDGCSLTLQDLIRIGKKEVQVGLSERAKENVIKGRAVVDNIVSEKKIV